MLASKEFLPNVTDDTPIRGWVRGPIEFHAVAVPGQPPVAHWADDAIVGYSCEYIGALADGNYLHFRDGAYVVPAEHGQFRHFRIEIMMVYEIRDPDGRLVEEVQASSVDASYYRRVFFYDALREAEEAVAEDMRTGVPILDRAPDAELADIRQRGGGVVYDKRLPLEDPFTAVPFAERVAEVFRRQSRRRLI